ncbi:MAG: histidine kinase [Pseudomonadota bacterium]|nr:histidine kinase [Pseudomonadota bacterium]
MRLSRFEQMDWLRYAGLFTLACVGMPLIIDSWNLLSLDVIVAWFRRAAMPESIAREEVTELVGWWVSYAVFGFSYWFATADLGAVKSAWKRLPLLVSMSAAAVAISWFSQSGLSGILLMVIAGVLPWLLPIGVAVIWLIAQNFSLLPTFLGLEDATGEPLYSWFDAILQSFLYLGFSSFTFATSYVTKGQAQAREEQRRLNAELRATRALLAESSRVAERVRIARELHDLVGHHLTALTLNLEVASHLVGGVAHEKVRQAQSVAKLLLSDVREVVSQLRDDSDIDLGTALRTLVEGLPAPTVHLDLPAQFQIDDARHAHVLLRCAQETLTNTIRHARASNLWWRFAIELHGAEVVFESRNDGVGVEGFTAGNGLIGMQERVREVGGSMQVNTAPGRGFSLRVWIPMEVK